MSSSSASNCPPPSPKIVKRSPSGVVKPDMFSIAPSSSRSNFTAMSAARFATVCAAGCGIVTSTSLACGSSWASVIETSPVPGGRSSSRYSSSPQATSSRNCWIALCSIGPRQTTAEFSSTKKPIDITLTLPAASSGRILRSASTSGLWLTPSMRGIE